MKEKLLLMVQDKQRVSMFRRIFAYLIDAYIVTVLCNIPILYLKSIKMGESIKDVSLNGFNSFESLSVIGIGIVFSLIYLVWFQKRKGQTFGKKLMNIKVVSLKSDTLSYKQMFLRAFIGMILIEGVLFCNSLLFQEYISRYTNISFSLFNVYMVITGVSILFSLINKNQAMFHDLLAQTRVIKYK